MVSEVIADLQLIPRSGEPVAAVGYVAAEEPDEPKRPKRPKRLLRFWIPAAAVLVVLCALGVVWLAGSWVPWLHAAADDRALDLKVPSASVPAPATTDTGETRATETAPNSAPFAITVEPDQTLQDISEQYLGGFDLHRLHQIQALNPKLTDPDHIETGQKIWLPGPPPVRIATNATPPASARKLP